MHLLYRLKKQVAATASVWLIKLNRSQFEAMESEWKLCIDPHIVRFCDLPSSDHSKKKQKMKALKSEVLNIRQDCCYI